MEKVAPLPILLAIGNGKGGGDYCGRNAGCAGRWCVDSPYLELSMENPDGYAEFAPDFTENSPVIPYTEIENELKKAADSEVCGSS